MNFNIASTEILEVLHLAQENLLRAEKIKFEKSKEWRENKIPNAPGVYAFFEKGNKILYIGEIGNLKKRMDEINRTVNHSFRKQIGFLRFNGIKSSKKYDLDIETKLDSFFAEEIYVSFIEVYFGRLEIEEFIISNHQQFLTNSVKKRKLTTIMDYIKEIR
jgi:hypothetical protein